MIKENPPMTHEQFRRRALKLLREARHAGLCPACITLELATAAAAIVELAHVTPDQLVLLQRRRQIHFSASAAPLQRSLQGPRCSTSAFVLAPPQRLDFAQFLSIFAAGMGGRHRKP